MFLAFVPNKPYADKEVAFRGNTLILDRVF